MGKGDPLGVILAGALYRQVLAAAHAGRALDAYRGGLQAGPMETWTGVDEKVLASHLAEDLGGEDLAWRLISQAYRQNPRSVPVLLQRLDLMKKRCGVFSAWQFLERLEKGETEDPTEKAEVLVRRGGFGVGFHDFETAATCFKEARTLAPESPSVWTESAKLWVEQGKRAAALEFVDYALSLQPWFPAAVQLKARYLQDDGQEDEALGLLEAARAHLQQFHIIVQLIEMYHAREDWRRILALLEEAKRLSPLADDPTSLWLAARAADAHLGLGDLENATDLAGRAAKFHFYGELADRLRQAPVPLRRVKLRVPWVRRENKTGAPAALAAIAAFWHRPIDPDMLIEETGYDGTTDFAERRWAQKNGWLVREFKVTWDAATALLDLGAPFLLTPAEIDSDAPPMVIGYDAARQSLLLADPRERYPVEIGSGEFARRYDPVGRRGLLILPPEKSALVAEVPLPDSELYDFHFRIQSALEENDRPRAEAALQELGQAAPGHRLYWMGRRALAGYDQNPLLQLEALDQLRLLYPQDDRLLHFRIGLLRLLGRNEEVLQLLRDRMAAPKVPSALRLDYVRELTRGGENSQLPLRLAWRELKRDPRNSAALGALAGLLWNAYRREPALAVQRLAASVGDKREALPHGYFQMLLSLGRKEEGFAYLHHRAGILLERSGRPTLTLAEALHQLNRTQDAREILQAARVQRPRDAGLLLYSAQLEAVAGQEKQSVALLESASAHAPRPVWLRAAARLQQRAGHGEMALASWTELAALAPLDLEAQREIARLRSIREGKKAGDDYVEETGRKFPHHFGFLQLETAWLRDKRPEEIERRLVEFVALNPSNAWAQREIAILLQKRQADEDALQRAQFARHIDPANPDSWQVEATLWEKRGREEEAREYFRSALNLRIDSDYALRRLLFLADSPEQKTEVLTFVRQQIERQKMVGPAFNAYREMAFAILPLEELTGHLRDLWRRCPDRFEAWNALSVHLAAIGPAGEAEEIAAAAADRFPLIAAAWRRKGVVQAQAGRWNEAADSLRMALQIEPDHAATVESLANAYRRSNRLEEGLTLLERTHRRQPLQATTLGAWADYLWQADKREDALARMQQAVQIDPEYQWGLKKLSRWSREIRGEDLALDACRERAQRLERDATAWINVARLAGHPDEAPEQLKAAFLARACEPLNIAANDLVALALVHQRRYDEALAACRPSAFAGRVPIPLRGREAWVMAQQGRLADGIKAMTTVVGTDPHYQWGWEMLAEWQLRRKEQAPALQAVEVAIRLSPTSAKAFTTRADLYLQTDRRAEAKQDYLRAFVLAPSSVHAGWKLFQLQLDDREFPEADRTFALLQAHGSPGLILPAKILSAAKSDRMDEALDFFTKAALSAELDVGALQEAVAAIDKMARGNSINQRLGSVRKNPAVHPFCAAMWVSRRGKAFSWRLLKQFQEISPKANVHGAFLERWLQEARKHGVGLQAVRTVQKHAREYALQDTGAWGIIGRILLSHHRYRETVHWLKDWESREDVRCWMVTNLVFALHSLGRTAEADTISRTLLDGPLRDHTTSYHLAYLALTSLEKRETAAARAHLEQIHFEGKEAEAAAYIQRLLAAAVGVQEATTPAEREDRFLDAMARSKKERKNLTLSRHILDLEKRTVKCLARDAGKFLPGLHVPRTRRRRVAATPLQRKILFLVVLILLVPVIIKICALAFSAMNGSSPAPAALPAPDEPNGPSFSPSSGNTSVIYVPQESSVAEQSKPVGDQLESYRAALKMAPNDVAILSHFSNVESDLRQYAAAVDLAGRAVKIAPHDVEALNALALGLMKEARYDDAERVARQIEQTDALEATGPYVLGVSALARKDWPTAIDRLTLAVRLRPSFPDAWQALSISYVRSNQLALGTATVQELLRANPNREAGWRALAEIRLADDDFSSALAATDKARALDANDYLLWNLIGLARSRGGQYSLAEEAFHAALDLSPTFDDGWNNLGYACLLDKKPDQAIQAFHLALSANPRNARALSNLAHAYIEKGEWDLAQKTCDNLGSVDPRLAAKIRTEIP